MELDLLLERLLSLKETYGGGVKVFIDHRNFDLNENTDTPVEEVYSPGEGRGGPVDTSKIFIQ